MKTYLFQLNHPAHYHLFKNTIEILSKRGHKIVITNKRKDVLESLLNETKHITISNSEAQKGLFNKIVNLFKREVFLNKIIRDSEPDVLIGTAPEIAHLGKINGIPSIFFGEDDVNLSVIMYLGALGCYPFFDTILSPKNVKNSIWKQKTIFYDGFQKLAYLHPSFFTPDRNKVEIPIDEHYFLLRFTNLTAYHDINAKGLCNDVASKLINLLATKGKVLISSERPLPPEFERYSFKGNKQDMHHYLYYSTLFIGDSQSMAVEASMLGVPNIRFSDFVGKITVLEELEHSFHLTTGIQTKNTNELFSLVQKYLSESSILIRNQQQKKRLIMLESKINVTDFFVWFIENYPESKSILKQNPDLQYTFR